MPQEAGRLLDFGVDGGGCGQRPHERGGSGIAYSTMRVGVLVRFQYVIEQGFPSHMPQRTVGSLERRDKGGG